MGANKSRVDHPSTGGYSCGIRPDGKLDKLAYDSHGKSFSNHPQGYRFEDGFIPSFKSVTAIIRSEHIKFPHFRLISWDFAIDKNTIPILVEYNLGFQGLNPHQLNNGPLFGDLTNEVLKEVFNKR